MQKADSRPVLLFTGWREKGGAWQGGGHSGLAMNSPTFVSSWDSSGVWDNGGVDEMLA
jgi:hypothetical protein